MNMTPATIRLATVAVAVLGALLFYFGYVSSASEYAYFGINVDTIGLSTKTFVDNYRTPHTEQLHVIERFHLVDGGAKLEVDIHVEDPGAFTMPWNAVQRFARWNTDPLLAKGESICAESAAYDYFNTGNYGASHVSELAPIPQANEPDF